MADTAPDDDDFLYADTAKTMDTSNTDAGDTAGDEPGPEPDQQSSLVIKADDDEDEDEDDDEEGMPEIILDDDKVQSGEGGTGRRMFGRPGSRPGTANAGAFGAAPRTAQPVQSPITAQPGPKSAFELDVDLEDKPWRKPGADITDYFNYGFNEDSWKQYCSKQVQLRLEQSMQGKIKVYSSDIAPHLPSDLPPELLAMTMGDRGGPAESYSTTRRDRDRDRGGYGREIPTVTPTSDRPVKGSDRRTRPRDQDDSVIQVLSGDADSQHTPERSRSPGSPRGHGFPSRNRTPYDRPSSGPRRNRDDDRSEVDRRDPRRDERPRSRDERPRDERSRDEKPREEKAREELRSIKEEPRSRDDRSRDDRSRDERPRDDRSRDDRSGRDEKRRDRDERSPVRDVKDEPFKRRREEEKRR
eukprot:TRINITY_DN902_c0_g1_i1.p1 TRINITY_DN902_c0_g1~~TRINITY_DN902_c0_g1_i1.p1  ORF type:complete len:414 (-),score=114.99 TRINITY_DN902_c0_g1_i1:38-1279(-)